MVEEGATPEWYYVGHYGQLGPLTFEQMEDLIADGVIDSQTFVWKNGMPDWSPAKTVSQFNKFFRTGLPPTSPYPQTGTSPPQFNPNKTQSDFLENPHQYPTNQQQSMSASYPTSASLGMHHYAVVPKSDKNRIAAGVLNLLPGFGRFYLGYAAHGVLQLLTSFCFVGLLWSWLDGLYIMVGGVKYDGYGRVIED